MNGIENIIEQITKDVRLEIDELKAKTAEECEKILAEAKETAQAEYWKIVREGSKNAQQRGERMGIVAGLEAKKQVLAVKQELIDETFDKAAHMIAELPQQEYIDFLVRLACEASGTGKEQVIFAASESEALKKAVVEKANEKLAAEGRNAGLTVSEESRDMIGGVILKRENVDINCSIETLIEMKKNELISEVSQMIF